MSEPGGAAFRARAFSRFAVDDSTGAATLTSTPTDLDFFLLHEAPLPLGLDFANLHYGFAIALFVTLLYFCFFVFLKTEERHKVGGKITTMKLVRNTIYVVCGLIILLSMIKLGVEFSGSVGETDFNTPWNRARQTFFWESVALWAFGLSWLVKGKFIEGLYKLLTGKNIVPPET